MYRINLYRAGQERRARLAHRVRRSALMTLLTGVQIVILGLFIVAVASLEARTRTAQGVAASYRKRLSGWRSPSNRTAVDAARILVQRRASRDTWSPVLAEIGRTLPDNLILDLIEASRSGGGGPSSGMILSGRIRIGRAVDPVVVFTRRLDDSPVYRAQFGEAKLDRINTTEETATFTVGCPLLSAAKSSADSTGEGHGG